jgi:hypothetical protein
MKLTAEEFLIDLVYIIKENLDSVKEDPQDDYNNGKVFAYFDVLTLIQMQAQGFGIDIKELGLDYDLMQELTYNKKNE